MPFSKSILRFVGAWLLFLLVYAIVALSFHRGHHVPTTFGDVAQCIVPLIANAGLLLNAGTPHWRRNLFWMLIAMSCTLWMIGQFEWTYYELYLHKPPPTENDPEDIIFFLRGIPMMAALTLRPHLKRGELHLRFGYLDFVLLLAWWVFLYVYIVLPWMYAVPSPAEYNYNYILLHNIQNMLIIGGFGYLWLRSSGAWRVVYAHLFGASALYMLCSLTINVALEFDRYYTGSLYDLPLVSSFMWFALAGLVAYQRRAELEAASSDSSEAEPGSATESVVPARLAMAAVISWPLFAIYTLRFAHESPLVRDFRLMTVLLASIPLTVLVFLRTYLADADRSRLLSHSERSVQNLQRLQEQLVHSEKLVSLGQLAAGAAHEINNPLTAILGFSDLLADDSALSERARSTAGKIREQARRTKTLVGNLLSFARQVPAERTLLDINTVVNNAVQLRTLDIRSSSVCIELQLESVLPGVRGDGNQLMQVFFNIISNAVDAMESANGGALTIKTTRDRAYVAVLFSDTGPGLKEPHRVFDPFYTTKPVGKGTGLGLSICFGIVQEHGGRIHCYNRQEGGAVFRVELPAVLAALPTKDLQLTTPSLGQPKPN